MAKAKQAKQAPEGHFLNAKTGRFIPDEFKGTKAYVVAGGKMYANGRLYREGERVVLTDSAPSSVLVPLETEPVAAKPEKSGKGLQASESAAPAVAPKGLVVEKRAADKAV